MSTRFQPRPSYLQGAAGRLFVSYTKAGTKAKAAVLCVPPFGEEMNRTRSLMAAQAREFARLGYDCLILDLFGTGDSAGDLPEASWETWCDDVRVAADWLERESGSPVILWGIRLGCLLAAEVASTMPKRFDRLLFWQPVTSGKSYLTQVLRLRVSALVDRNAPPETTTQMRERLAAGSNVEVSGYLLPGSLTTALDTRQMADFGHWDGKSIDWLDCVAEPGKAPTGASRKVVDALEEKGARVKLGTAVAPPVWSLHQPADASSLVTATSKLFDERVAK
jgi:exosortase A-associated hydrolase 2